jgi:hypothetical protein
MDTITFAPEGSLCLGKRASEIAFEGYDVIMMSVFEFEEGSLRDRKIKQ